MMSIGQSQLDTALRALGELLAARGFHYEVVVIGGGNLILRGLVTRPTTRDLDLLGSRTARGVERMRPMPEPLRTAVLDVTRAYGLADDSVNLASSRCSISACRKGSIVLTFVQRLHQSTAQIFKVSGRVVKVSPRK